MRALATSSTLALVLMMFASAGTAQDAEPVAKADESLIDDGLVLVPSSRKGLVYRSPDVRFERYRQVIIEPVTVTFKSTWRREYPRLSESDVEKIRSRAAEQFHEQLQRELVKLGHYSLAETPATDVLTVKARILEFDQKAPAPKDSRWVETYALSAGDMVLVVELYDAASGVLVARIVDPEKAKEYGQLQLIDKIFVENEARKSFANAARLTREALNVAITERPRQPGGQ
jgi:hypothetical protein